MSREEEQAAEAAQFARALEMVEGLIGLMVAAGMDHDTIAQALVSGSAQVAQLGMTEEAFAKMILETLKAYQATKPTEQ